VATGVDRFCESCGSALEAGPDPTGRRETDLGAVAAVSDRGLHRRRNDDSYAIDTVGEVLLAVVCDGVATTDEAGPAAAAAARAALACLLAGVSDPTGWTSLAQDAVAAAQEAVQLAPGPSLATDGSTTLALGLLRTGEIVVANVGDSRAYWIGDDGQNALLSVDDSWENFAAAAGYPEAEVRNPSRQHEITAWLGPDAGLLDPHVARHCPAGGGLLVLCSDGLWNYAGSPESLATLVEASRDRRPGGVARDLAQAAIDAGGADNVTVAVLAHPPHTDDDKEKGGARDGHV
jgi:serine/threonine protein phosphatase PrpC